MFMYSKCQALLNMLGSTFILILKHDVRQGIIRQLSTMVEVVSRVFLVKDDETDTYFAILGTGDDRFTKSLKECFYYVALLYAHFYKKVKH